MPLYQTVTYASTGTKDSVNTDPSIAPFNATLAVTLTGGTTSYKAQWSISAPDIADSDALWFDSTDIPASTSSSKVSYLTAPVSRVRLVIASLSGGNLVMQLAQGYTKN